MYIFTDISCNCNISAANKKNTREDSLYVIENCCRKFHLRVPATSVKPDQFADILSLIWRYTVRLIVTEASETLESYSMVVHTDIFMSIHMGRIQ